MGSSSAPAAVLALALALADGPPLAEAAGAEPVASGAVEAAGAADGGGVLGEGMHPPTTNTARATVAAMSDPRGPMG
jgi:hypothetical protein